MSIVQTTETLVCCDCDVSLPPWKGVLDGEVERPMQDRNGNIRCECCHDDYIEAQSEDY